MSGKNRQGFEEAAIKVAEPRNIAPVTKKKSAPKRTGTGSNAVDKSSC